MTPTRPLRGRRRTHAGHQLFLAAVTVAELRYGALVAGWGVQRRQCLEQSIAATTVVPVSDALLTAVAELRHDGLTGFVDTPELVECLVEDLLKVRVDAWKQMFASLLVYDDTTKLSQLTAPGLLVWGDADQLVPRAMQDQLLDLLPRTELTVYVGAGHTPRWEQPERFAKELTTFGSQVLGS